MISKSNHRKAGISLVEVTVAMAITAFTCSGLYTMGLSLRRTSERSRIKTEACAYAKEALEEIISIGLANLAQPGCTLVQSTTEESSTGARLSRSVRVYWHDKNGTVVTTPDDEGYAEVHVTVTFPAPLSGAIQRNTYSTIIN